MLFSILIPTYNNEKTIARTIESALNQEYSGDYEIVIVNNASTDATLSVIESYEDPKIKVITNPRFHRVSIRRTVEKSEQLTINDLTSFAIGDYVVFCHSDDMLMPEALKVLAKKIEERMYPQRYIVWGHSMFMDFANSMQSYDTMLTYNTMFSGLLAKKIFLGDGLTPSGTCYSKKIFQDLGYFPVVDGTCDSDWIFGIIAAFNACEFEMLDRILFFRTVSSTYGDSMNAEIRQEMLNKAALALKYYITEDQMNEVYALWREYHYFMLDYIFYKPETIEERKSRYINEIKNRPWSLRKILRLISMYMKTISR